MEHVHQDVCFSATVSQLKDVFSTFKDLFIEADLRFTPSGLVVRGMDANKTTTTQAFLFDPEYHFVKSAKIGVYMHMIYRILRCLRPHEKVSFVVESYNPSTLLINNEDHTEIAVVSRHLAYDDILLPTIIYDCEIPISGKDLFRAIKEVSHLSKFIDFEVDGVIGKVYVKTSTPTSHAKIFLADIDIEEGRNIEYKSTYDVRHLDHFCKHLGKEPITVKIKQGQPLCLSAIKPIGVINFYVSEVIFD